MAITEEAGEDATSAGRFETRLRTAGLLLGPSSALLVYLVNPGGHPPAARTLLAILALTICFWITEAIPLPATALLSSSLAILCGVAPARAVFEPYADPVIFLFVGSFLLAEAFSRYGLDRRVAARALGREGKSRSRMATVFGLGTATAFVSCWLSNTATAALMTPMAVGLAGASDRVPAEGSSRSGAGGSPRWVSALLLMVAYGASIGGMATLVGTPPNLLVAGFLERLCGVKVGFAAWLLFGLPIAMVLFAASLLWVRLVLLRGEKDGLSSSLPRAASLPPPDRDTAKGARLTIAAFVLAGVLWMLPSMAAVVLGASAPVTQRLAALLPESAVALFCAALLFVAPVNWRHRRFALSWREGRRVNWGIILLFGGGLSLGTLAESTGLARWVGEGLGGMGLARSESGLLFCAIALTIIVSEFASNTAAATLLVPVVIAAAQSAGFDPVRPALGVGLAATCGFIFPVSTPPNAIVYGTGLLSLRRMIPAGLLLDLTSLVVIWGGMMLLSPVLPR
jgi:sodium-dependent dicarboxylate transporter 2/3/5